MSFSFIHFEGEDSQENHAKLSIHPPIVSFSFIHFEGEYSQGIHVELIVFIHPSCFVFMNVKAVVEGMHTRGRRVGLPTFTHQPHLVLLDLCTCLKVFTYTEGISALYFHSSALLRF